MKRLGVFLSAFLSLIGTVVAYAHLGFDRRLIIEPSLARLLQPVTGTDAAYGAVGCALVPAIVAAATAAYVVPNARGRAVRWAVELFVYTGCWLAGAYITAGVFSVEFGNTWTAREVWSGLVLDNYFALPLLCLGFGVNLLLSRCMGAVPTSVDAACAPES